MSCLSLGKRLQPAKKAWKMFTSKLHSKFPKLYRSKAINKKQKNLLKPLTKAVSSWPALTFHPRLHHKRRTIKTTRTLHCYHLHKRSAPVYIDELFKEPLSALKEHRQPPTTVATTKRLITEKCLTGLERAKLPYQRGDDVAGTSEEAVEAQQETCGADDMWESLGLASPLMQGINERAEEFITRIRAEMQIHEEMIARRL